MDRTMSKSAVILKRLLFAGAVYFLAVAIVHMFRIKIPLLFHYYNLPSYGYQDRLISFLSFGWLVFLFMAFTDPARNHDEVKAILIADLAAIFGLNVINSVTDFHALSQDIHLAVFRKEVLALSKSFNMSRIRNIITA